MSKTTPSTNDKCVCASPFLPKRPECPKIPKNEDFTSGVCLPNYDVCMYVPYVAYIHTYIGVLPGAPGYHLGYHLPTPFNHLSIHFIKGDFFPCR
jgi:hypothetical protein